MHASIPVIIMCCPCLKQRDPRRPSHWLKSSGHELANSGSGVLLRSSVIANAERKGGEHSSREGRIKYSGSSNQPPWILHHAPDSPASPRTHDLPPLAPLGHSRRGC